MSGKYIVKTSEPHPWMWGIYHSEGTSCQPYEEFSNILEANRRVEEMNRRPAVSGEGK